jgi:hypothetical protein
MRKYHGTASSSARFQYGVELHAGLAQFPETADAAADVLAVNDALHAQFQKRLGLVVPVVKTRAALRFAEYHVDSVLRSAFHAAQIEDGGRSGRVCQAVFPEGIREVTRPAGRGQVKPTKDVIERLKLAKVAGVDDYRQVWLPKLESALEQLEGSIAAHEAATLAHQDAFAEERALREAHHETVDKVIGMVRAAFPRDRNMQDVIFPVAQRNRARVAETDEDEGPESPPVNP